MDRVLFHVDNVYNIPNVRTRARMCHTHIPSCTAFRGFGGPQSMIVTEAIVQHVADKLKMVPEKVNVVKTLRLRWED
jgi:xanthine dehydrogenase/oxidase